MTNFKKGDYTKCYEDICEIWYEDNLYCIVRTEDADKIINVLNEHEKLKQQSNNEKLFISKEEAEAIDKFLGE